MNNITIANQTNFKSNIYSEIKDEKTTWLMDMSYEGEMSDGDVVRVEIPRLLLTNMDFNVNCEGRSGGSFTKNGVVNLKQDAKDEVFRISVIEKRLGHKVKIAK